MNGSSRSLIKALSVLTDDWRENAGIDKINSDSTDLFKIISSFCEKHNDLQSIRQTIDVNDELFRIYNNYIKSFSDMPREILFLEILTQLLPILIDDGIFLWLKTYLKPATDSAGFDVVVVSKSREFIKLLSMKPKYSDDPLLTERRTLIANTAINNVLELYVCQNAEIVEMIGLHIPNEESDNQVYYERVRYMKRNCEDLLHEYGLKKPREYFELINKHFKLSSKRLDMLTLLSRLVSSNMSQVHHIINTDLFYNLLRSLLYDFDESVILVSLSIIVMLIPHISNKLSKSFRDLLVIYIRLSNWESFDKQILTKIDYHSGIFDEHLKPWDFAGIPETNLPNPKVELDTLHLLTLLYGLFPLNLCKFCKSPFEFLNNLPSKIFKQEILTMKDNENGTRKLEEEIIDITSYFLRSFTLHPNFLRHGELTLLQELKNPLLWLLEEVNGSDITFEEISLGCLGLNPRFVTGVFDTLGGYMLGSNNKDLLEADTLSNDSRLSGFIYRGTGGSNACSLANSRHVSRKSSFTTPLYFNKDGLAQRVHLSNSLVLLNSKLSNYMIRNRDNSTTEIKFKDVKFDEGSIKENEAENNSINEETISSNEIVFDNSFEGDYTNPKELDQRDKFRSNQLLNDLFSAHEKLYSLSSKAIDSKMDSSVRDLGKGIAISSDNKGRNEFLPQRPIISPNTALETTSLNRGSISGTLLNVASSDPQQDINTSNKANLGTALDFYHRELLLIKNELEFSNYMKELNKTQYIKLKVKLTKLKRQGGSNISSIEQENNRLKIDSLKSGYDSVVNSLEKLRLDLGESETRFKSENSILFNKIKDLESENNDLKSSLTHANAEQQMLKNSISHAMEQILPEKEFELDLLRKTLTELETVNRSLQIDIKEAREDHAREETKGDNSFTSQLDVNLSDLDKLIFNLKNELLMINDKNIKLSQELTKLQELYDVAVKSYEFKISSSKLELNKNISSFTTQYEKKIQELSSIIHKYEGLLDEKNKMLVLLSSSKPIKISNNYTRAMTPTNDMKSYGTGILLLGRDLNLDKPQDQYEHDSRGRLTPSSAEVVYNPHFEQAPLPQAHVPNSHFQSSTIAPPIIRGRGGIQKRSKKHM